MDKLIALKCPRCSSDLLAEDGSPVSYCLKCRQACEIANHGFSCHVLEFIRPQKELPLPATYFPFWLIGGDFAVQAVFTKKRRCGQAAFYVPAFFIKKTSFFGDIGLFYSLRPLVPAAGPGLDLPIFPACRGSAVALRYPALYLQTELSGHEDIQGLEVAVTAQVQKMLLVPFYRDKERFIDSQIGWEYPASALL